MGEYLNAKKIDVQNFSYLYVKSNSKVMSKKQ